MTNEKAIKHLEVIKGDCALVGDIRALDMAISALSTEGEYIKKADMERILYSTNNAVRIGELFLELPTYTIPGTAKTGEYIKKADAIRIASITTLSVDQVVSTIKALSTYSIPDSDENTGEWIYTEDRPEGFCSKCDRDIAEAPTPYCPYCGAKMTWVGAIHEPYKAESEDKEW